ncbi:MAG: hypothetical protein UV73_C0012G0008 [Candidatus Gottesmanbacteria bacterium GW2011_GWA2_43_14]|uniref:Uncharacterized protein n=1 Tax=Candidatus Gottesmanbacteria bacterium GW2011_GWA2_43_14 TaxID=1618443 RepID=A0A0G1DDK5_9BACT|nr:MAG: hypothetical protein UV73_C0012G0008 [Candidatus Gottesmanbacteria bacterium GW2011_GWA2_43_14]
MKKLLIFLLVDLIIGIALVFFLMRPKTLGIRYTAEDLSSVKAKLNVTTEALPTNTPLGQTLLVTGGHPVDATFTSQELTALVDNRHNDYAYFPFRNVQIRIVSDGSVEGSATVSYQDAVNYLVSLGIAQADISEGVNKFKIPKTNLPVYLKVSGSIENNQSLIKIHGAKIANISIPQKYITEYSPALLNLIDDVIADRQPSVDIYKLGVENGQVRFQGTAPDKEQAVRGN